MLRWFRINGNINTYLYQRRFEVGHASGVSESNLSGNLVENSNGGPFEFFNGVSVSSLFSNKTGIANTAIGLASLQKNYINGNDNTAVGAFPEVNVIYIYTGFRIATIRYINLSKIIKYIFIIFYFVFI